MRHLPISTNLFEKNRGLLSKRLPKQAIALISANDFLPTNADGHFPLHPNSDLFYLSGIEQEETILLIFPDAEERRNREILFIRKPNDEVKIWQGCKLSKKEARSISAIQTIHWIEEFDKVFQVLAAEVESIVLNENEHSRAVKAVETPVRLFNRVIQEKFPLHRIERLAPHLHHLRFAKDSEEINLIKQAIEITNRGFRKVLRMIKPGIMEFEVEAVLAGEFIKRRSKFAYPPIVASGANACVLHYHQNDQTCKKGDLILMDVGANYANYNADLSRTIPVGGKFSRRQKQVYKSVLRVLRLSIANASVGKSLKEWQEDSYAMMNEELVRLKILTKNQIIEQDPEHPACRKFFMHGLGHSLGLDVHDVSNRQNYFRENSVFTVEPGIYLPEEGIGIRLEDNIVITSSGPINLMDMVPIEPEEIEDIMNR